jgi:hypothetical protein
VKGAVRREGRASEKEKDATDSARTRERERDGLTTIYIICYTGYVIHYMLHMQVQVHTEANDTEANAYSY